MEQTDARKIASRLNEVVPITTWIAQTRDHFNGEWEKTHEWGVSTSDGWFYGTVDELPGIAREKL